MNPEVKKKWVNALRSGNYKQGKGRLVSPCKNEDGRYEYCCLGVLCDLYSHEHPKATWYEDAFYPLGIVEDKGGYLDKNYCVDEELPQEVIEWAQVEVEDPVLYDDDVGDCLITCIEVNDNQGKDFNQIADLIDRYL